MCLNRRSHHTQKWYIIFLESLQNWFGPLTRSTDLFGYTDWATYIFTPPVSHQPSKPLLKQTLQSNSLISPFVLVCSPLYLSVPCNPHPPPMPRISTCEKRLHKAPPGPSTRAPKGAPCSTTWRPIHVSQGVAPERRRPLATCRADKKRCQIGRQGVSDGDIYLYIDMHLYISMCMYLFQIPYCLTKIWDLVEGALP